MYLEGSIDTQCPRTRASTHEGFSLSLSKDCCIADCRHIGAYKSIELDQRMVFENQKTSVGRTLCVGS